MSKRNSLALAKRAQKGRAKKQAQLNAKNVRPLSSEALAKLKSRIAETNSVLRNALSKPTGNHQAFESSQSLVEECYKKNATTELSDLFFRRYSTLALRLNKTDFVINQLQRIQQKERDHSYLNVCLAGMFGTLGDEKSSTKYARKYFKKIPLTLNVKKDARLNLLVLKTATSGKFRLIKKTGKFTTVEGHNNLASLLDPAIARTVVRVDTPDAAIAAIRKLPVKPDLIFNNITDPERCEQALKSAQRICDAVDLPVINPPHAVLSTSREANYARFKALPDILMPKSMKIERTQESAKNLLSKALQQHGFELPVIIRLAGFQGGKYMHKVDNLATHDFSDLDEELAKHPQTVYLIQYHEVSYIDERAPRQKLYPKYRAFMVGDTLYPCHAFTADGFNVHKKNADPVMAAHSWLKNVEQDYCENPIKHIGKEQWQALEASMCEAGLGYNGVDFAPATSPEHKGKLVVFEMNPAMLNGVSQLPEGDHAQQAWKKITEAAHQYFSRMANVDAWDFDVPRGKR